VPRAVSSDFVGVVDLKISSSKPFSDEAFDAVGAELVTTDCDASDWTVKWEGKLGTRISPLWLDAGYGWVTRTVCHLGSCVDLEASAAKRSTRRIHRQLINAKMTSDIRLIAIAGHT
jgi:hypothetical protein